MGGGSWQVKKTSFKTQNSKLTIHNSKLKIQNSSLVTHLTSGQEGRRLLPVFMRMEGGLVISLINSCYASCSEMKKYGICSD